MYPFKNILLSVDFSPLSRSLLKYAAAFAKHYNACLYIHNVQEAGIPPQALQLSEHALREHGYEWVIAVRHELEELGQQEILKGVDVHLLLTEGEPASEIARIAEKHEIDLSIIGIHRRGAIEKAILGSTCESVLEKIHCPVLLSRQPSHDFVYYRGAETTIALNRVLFATDFSGHDIAVKNLVLQLVQSHNSKLLLMHALGIFLGYVRSVSISDTEDIEKRIRKDAMEKLNAVKAEAGSLEVETFLCEGRTYEEILKIGSEYEVDLIVIGIGGRSTGHILGRNAERVIRNAHCPVLVVPS